MDFHIPVTGLVNFIFIHWLRSTYASKIYAYAHKTLQTYNRHRGAYPSFSQLPTLMFMPIAAAATEVGPLGPPQPARVVRVVGRRVHRHCGQQRKVPFTISHCNSYSTIEEETFHRLRPVH